MAKDPNTDGTPGGFPVMQSDMTFADVGSWGLRQFSGWVREEFLPQLTGRQAARVFREMSDNNATCGSILFAITQSLRNVKWQTIAADDSPEAAAEAEFAESLRMDMCYDDQTQILTDRGWLYFKDLTSTDRVAQRAASGAMEFVRPKKLHVFPFNGDLLGYRGDAVDFLVTPSHRMLFAPRRGRKHDSSQKVDLGIYRCEEIFNQSGWLSKQVKWNGTGCAHTEAWLEFLGFFVADGYASHRGQIVLIQKDHTYVDALIARAGVADRMKTRPVNGSTQWSFCDAKLARQLRDDFGATSRVKKLPQWLKNSTPDQLKAFLRGFSEGDGWESGTGLIALATSSKQLADDLQEIAMKAGLVANVSSDLQSSGFAVGAPRYRVGIWSPQEKYLQPYLKAGRGWYKQPYTGKVYCVAVSSGVIMVRRNGKAIWSGNSHTWEDFITEVLSMLTYGFAPHEIVYKKRLGAKPEGSKVPGSKFSDGRIGLRRLPIRGQDTIIKWFFDPNGSVRGMTQQPWTGAMIDLPIEKLLLFRPTAHKNNPEGRSILRSAYQGYYYVKRLQELEAIMLERMSGLPIMKIPSQVFEGAAANNPAAVQALAAYKRIVSNIRVDEQMGIVLPSDTYMGPTGPSSVPMYSFEFAVPGAGKGTTNFDTPITRYKIDIMTSVLADWLTMGHESRGTQSLAGTKVDMFFYAMEGWLDAIAAVLNRYLLPRIWRINGLDLSLMPQWLATMPRRIDIDALGSFILSLAQSGMQLFPDEDLENYIRDAAGLPDLSDHAEGDSGGSGKGPMSAADLKKALLSSAAKNILAKRRG